jgi:hypothetical protein
MEDDVGKAERECNILNNTDILNDIGDLISVKILNPKIRHGLCLSQNWNYPSAQ